MLKAHFNLNFFYKLASMKLTSTSSTSFLIQTSAIYVSILAKNFSPFKHIFTVIKKILKRDSQVFFSLLFYQPDILFYAFIFKSKKSTISGQKLRIILNLFFLIVLIIKINLTESLNSHHEQN